MKNFIKLFMVIALVSITLQLSAQIKYGVRAGLNFSNASFAYSVEDLQPETKMLMGFQLGVIAQIGVGDIIAVQSGLLFSQKGYQYNFEKSTTFSDATGYNKVILNYLEVPFYGTLTLLGVQIQAGPYVAFGLNGKNKWNYEYTTLGNTFTMEGESKIVFTGEANEEELEDDETPFKRLDWGVYIGAGYKVGPIKLNAGYQIGLNNIIPPSTDTNFDPEDFRTTNRALMLTAAFIF